MILHSEELQNAHSMLMHSKESEINYHWTALCECMP